MKKGIFLIFVFLFLTVSPVFAQSAEEYLEPASRLTTTPVASAGVELRQKIQEKREIFRQRLQEIKDQRKRTIVERINNRIIHLNQRWTDHFTNVLGRLLKILDKLQIKIDKAKEKGKDTNAAQSAWNEAKKAIETTQQKVLDQLGKSYVIEITSEETLKEAVKPLVDQFKEDLRTTKEAVKNARKAVINVFTTLRGLGPGGSPTIQPTVTPTPLPSPEGSP